MRNTHTTKSLRERNGSSDSEKKLGTNSRKCNINAMQSASAD